MVDNDERLLNSIFLKFLNNSNFIYLFFPNITVEGAFPIPSFFNLE